MQRPAGVTAIAGVFFLIAAFLCSCGIVVLTAPQALIILKGRLWHLSLEIGGPYLTLLIASVWGLIGWGLIRMRGWARIAAMVLMILGMSVAVSAVMTASGFHWSLILIGLEIFVRLAVVWYLFSKPIAEQFSKPARAT